jgi:hypothetical protein
MYSIIYENLCLGKYPIRSKHTEVHHIIPKHFGGSNDIENLIELDIRQHKIAHWLLWKLYKKDQDRLVWYMRSGRYEEGIELRKTLQNNYFENKNKMLSEELFNSFEMIKNNLPKLKESNQLSSFKYKKSTSEIKQYELNSSRITKDRTGRVQVNMFNKDGIFIQQFQSIYSANEALNYSSIGNIHSAASGNRNYAAGFRWSFTDIPNVLIPSKKRTYKKTGKQKNPSNHKVSISKQIIQCDLEGNEIHVWNNRKEIQENLNISAQMISHAVNGRSKNKDGEYRGFIWKKGKQLINVVYK